MTTQEKLSTMTISEIAIAVKEDWKNVDRQAEPYLDAMFELETIADRKGFDSGVGIVGYFVSLSSSWKGDVARLVKKELRKRIKEYNKVIIKKNHP